LKGTPRRTQQAGLVAIANAAASLSPAQKRFNKLVAEIAAERVLLKAWDDAIEHSRPFRAQTLEPALRGLRDLQLRMALMLESLLLDRGKAGKLKRRHHDAVLDTLLGLVGSMLEEHEEPELVALHDRHATEPWHAQQAFELSMLREDARNLFGDAMVDDVAGDSPEEFLDRLMEKGIEKAEAEQQERERQKAQQRAAKRRKAQAAAPNAEPLDASQSVREIFRRLASSLHPDREPDETERARKTALMQRANEAYARSDLLALLELQLETEQIDSEHLAGVSAQRLKHYNEVLAEQLAALRMETQMRAGGFGLDPRQPERLMKALHQQLQQLNDLEHAIAVDLASLADPRRRPAALDAMLAQQAEDDYFDDLFDSVLREAPFPRGRRRGGRR
jgi:hypothetical protein